MCQGSAGPGLKLPTWRRLAAPTLAGVAGLSFPLAYIRYCHALRLHAEPSVPNDTDALRG